MAKSKLFKDYDDDSPYIRFHKNREQYWQMLKDERENYTNDTMDDWMQGIEDKYGMRPILNESGSFTDMYEVIDEQKFLVYLLKYGGE